MAFHGGTYYRTPTHDSAVVGTSSALLADLNALTGYKAVMFQADSANAGLVAVMPTTATMADGFNLAAGENSPWLPLGPNVDWAAIASQATQNLRWIAVI